MRVVRILSGVSVLTTTLAFAGILRERVQKHLAFLQHLDEIHASHASAHTPSFLVMLSLGAAIVCLSALGGCFLFKPER